MSLELFYHVVKEKISTRFNACVAAVHFSLLNGGFKCVKLGEKVPSTLPEGYLSDLLPTDWNKSQKKCSLVYWNEKAKFFLLLKMFDMETFALVHTMREAGSSITDVDLEYNNFFGLDFTSFEGTFHHTEELTCLLQEKLIKSSMKTMESIDQCRVGTSQPPSSSSAVSSESFFSPSEREVLRQVTSDDFPTRPYMPCGRCDLDPLSRGCTCGGGMVFDPLRNFHPPSRPDTTRDPTRLPPGSVPPGARFDPIGPLPPLFGPPPPMFGPRRPMGPDPDEFAPPGFEDF